MGRHRLAGAMFYDDRRMAGLLLFVGAAVFLIFHIVAEAVDPTYSVSDNFISDLGVRAVNWFSDHPAEFDRGLAAAPAADPG